MSQDVCPKVLVEHIDDRFQAVMEYVQDIPTMKEDIGTLKVDVDILKSGVDTLKSDVAELKDHAEVTNERLGAIEAIVSEYDAKIRAN